MTLAALIGGFFVPIVWVVSATIAPFWCQVVSWRVFQAQKIVGIFVGISKFSKNKIV